HDPHATKPRIVRDALIEAVQRDGPNPYDPNYATKVEVQDFRGFRKIGMLNKPDSNLMCAQCHVEYNCNPGLHPDMHPESKIGMNDSRTNHFPWKNVFELQKHYDELNFRDFKHTITGAYLIKVQHPEAETFWGSAHEKAGVECKNCHMPRMKNPAGKEFTSHWQTSPRNYLNETCLKCHTSWTSVQAEYEIDAIQNYVKGKMRKSEFWLSRFIDTFENAKASGVNETALNEARKYHGTANVYWEWWTAENSDGFHNPEQARESLAKSIEASKKGIALLEGAMAQPKTQTMNQSTTPKAAPGFETAAAVMALIALASIALLRKRR
ncbi:MAG: ammonia-forming cytochrome c nitrite reductase subunit c552, partial [Candidatus Methanoperedens sp.]|nr:ammonia-forming cytochrome c nitrite reductase subunit c552 [Candidatus Methanoperedens sp.]